MRPAPKGHFYSPLTHRLERETAAALHYTADQLDSTDPYIRAGNVERITALRQRARVLDNVEARVSKARLRPLRLRESDPDKDRLRFGAFLERRGLSVSVVRGSTFGQDRAILLSDLGIEILDTLVRTEIRAFWIERIKERAR